MRPPAGGAGPIAVRCYGEKGPVVALLHGGPGAPGDMALLARALPGFRVLEPLQRRSGGAPLTVAGHVADLASVLPPAAALVGWSWGAMLALSFAAAHPGRVRSLALIGCGTYDSATRAAYERALASRLGEEGRRRADGLRREMDATASDEERERLLGDLGKLLGRAAACDPLPEEDEAVWVDARGHEETWADVLRLQAEGVEPAAFAAVGCPVLMLHGDEDPHPGPATFEVLRRFIPQLRYTGFPRCGHQPWAERHAREPFLAVLREWLDESGA
ncbi:MAG: alpha/beta hydrolase [Acidimicrobiia bacterium]|nr:alpha/beta hydrolase [Acidimicrobiia bacterium]